MAQTPCIFRNEGILIDYTPSGVVVAGNVVVQGTMIGIAPSAIAAGVKGALCVRGVFDVPKDNSNLAAVGTAIYWKANGNPVGGDAGSGAFTATPTGAVFAGWNLAIAGAGVGIVNAAILSSFAVSVTTTDDLTDVGTPTYAAGDLLVGDGTVFQGRSLSGPFALTAAGFLKIKTATVAAAGSTQSDAAAITNGFTLVSAADATKGVKLPTAVAGDIAVVKNAAAAVLKIWPNTDDAINAIAANGSFNIAATTSVILVTYDATTWYSVPLLPS